MHGELIFFYSICSVVQSNELQLYSAQNVKKVYVYKWRVY
jgi:hypothetical protein